MDSGIFFESVFNNAKLNAILIMDEKGIIIKANQAFSSAFGYTAEELKGQYFDLFFVDSDRKAHVPEKEIIKVNTTGSADDDNYLVHKDGTPVWVTGEAILAITDNGRYIVKIIHNIHAQKLLEGYLLKSNEILEHLFESVREQALLIINSQMQVLRANKAFLKMFDLSENFTSGSKMSDLGHPFWRSQEIKSSVRKMIIENIPLNEVYTLSLADSQRQFHITSKGLLNDDVTERQILFAIKEIKVQALHSDGL
ncbi:MAG TPA: PAS domain-containing protein [Flavitalea sp.]|nr:PAS domain-containing protein [Flavitalea sp.]